MNTVKRDFSEVLDSSDPKEWASRFVLIHYLREDFRNSPSQIQEMFELAFAAVRKQEKETA